MILSFKILFKLCSYTYKIFFKICKSCLNFDFFNKNITYKTWLTK